MKTISRNVSEQLSSRGKHIDKDLGLESTLKLTLFAVNENPVYGAILLYVFDYSAAGFSPVIHRAFPLPPFTIANKTINRGSLLYP